MSTIRKHNLLYHHRLSKLVQSTAWPHGVGFFCPTRLRMPSWIIFYINPKLGIPVEMVQFLLKLLFNKRFLAVYHDFQ